MSRAIRISCSESRTETVRVDDTVCTALEVLDVLPKEEMGELLARELAERGFKRDGGTMKKVVGDVNIQVDLAEGTVTARAAIEQKVDAQGSASRSVAVDNETERARLKETVNRQIDSKVDVERGRMTDALAAKLEKALRDVKNDLDRASARATAAGLKIKAAKLGEIEEVHEDQETGAITIRVRV